MPRWLRRTWFYPPLTLVALVWLVPVLLVGVNAVTGPGELYRGGSLLSLPSRVAWDNFTAAWETGRLSRYMANSLLICAIKVPLGVFVESLGAFALSRMRFRWATPVFMFVLIGMVLPVQAALIPLHQLFGSLGLLDTYTALLVIYVGFGVPFGTLVLRGFFATLPRSLDEAALIDGCSWWKLYWRVILPLARPALVALLIFDFLFTWNEFIFAQLFITTDALRPMQAGLLAFSSQYSQNVTLLSSGIVISIVPVVLVYMLFQRHFVSGLAGAIKA